MSSVKVRGSRHHLNCRTHPASGESFVVSEQFGGGLLEDWHPHGAVHSHFAVDEIFGAVVPERHLLVDCHGDRNTEHIELHGVDTGGVQVMSQEHILDSLRVTCDGARRSMEPTIAKISLLDIFG